MLYRGSVNCRPILHSIIATAVAIPIAGKLFSSAETMAASALIALSLGSTLQILLEENRKRIWDERDSPISANRDLAVQLLLIFVGVLSIALIFRALGGANFLGSSISPEGAFQNDFLPLFQHNLTILMLSTLISVFYQSGGLVMILAWNAFHWAAAFVSYLNHFYETKGITAVGAVAASMLPHLTCEVTAYFLGGMAGMFLFKALSKYPLTSPEFYRVSKACVILFITGLVILVVANSFEVLLAQPVFRAFL